mgnify:CR=1 FL=1|jgi:hypothetical protein
MICMFRIKNRVICLRKHLRDPVGVRDELKFKNIVRK